MAVTMGRWTPTDRWRPASVVAVIAAAVAGALVLYAMVGRREWQDILRNSSQVVQIVAGILYLWAAWQLRRLVYKWPLLFAGVAVLLSGAVGLWLLHTSPADFDVLARVNNEWRRHLFVIDRLSMMAVVFLVVIRNKILAQSEV